MMDDVMQVPEFFNRAARNRGNFTPVLIETHNEDGTVEWGVSITSANPEPEDYYACRTVEEALNLMAQFKDDASKESQ